MRIRLLPSLLLVVACPLAATAENEAPCYPAEAGFNAEHLKAAYGVTKSLLSSVVGVAFDRGMIRSLDDTMHNYVPPIEAYSLGKAGDPVALELITPLETAHNRTITWDHMLRQTSSRRSISTPSKDNCSAKDGSYRAAPNNRAGYRPDPASCSDSPIRKERNRV
jgi:CubicO group peptidase (beta-lactamase class C family)